MKVIAVIPARYASSRFPGKVLADLAGKPMVQHVAERAAQAKSVHRVLVATDDERIAAAVRAFGAEAVLTDPHHPSGTDRIAEAIREVACDVVVNVQGDEPLLPPQMVDEAVEPFFADPALEMGTVCRQIEDPRDLTDPNVVKVVRDLEGYALYFSRAPVPHSRDSQRGAGARPCKHIGLYVYRRAFLFRFTAWKPTPLEEAERLEQLRALEHGVRIKVVETRHDSVGVDTPDDLARVQRVLNERRVWTPSSSL
ncbi:MAG TPA: 3-deoxy-manno-octulosonate cytidylyltransferase [Candidatus Methylomirabilis sp.]|nr:3-deoxy-manno-octulosonate cytidylyltransferase [Candidatus Methylomirabilis sp.]